MDEACISKEDFVEIVAHSGISVRPLNKIGQARGRKVKFRNMSVFSRFKTLSFLRPRRALVSI